MQRQLRYYTFTEIIITTDIYSLYSELGTDLSTLHKLSHIIPERVYEVKNIIIPFYT